jgi:GGDEF domain-containing protein
VADHIKDALVAPIAIADGEVRIGASIGIGTLPDDGADVDAILGAADLRMYRDKRFQRGSSPQAPPLPPDAAERARWVESLWARASAAQRQAEVIHTAVRRSVDDAAETSTWVRRRRRRRSE